MVEVVLNVLISGADPGINYKGWVGGWMHKSMQVVGSM